MNADKVPLGATHRALVRGDAGFDDPVVLNSGEFRGLRERHVTCRLEISTVLEMK